MSVEDVQTIVVEVLREVQTLSGRPCDEIEPTAKPIGSLEGFDSLCGIEATVMLEEKLSCGDLGIASLFVSTNGRRALTVAETAQRISRVLSSRGGNHGRRG